MLLLCVVAIFWIPLVKSSQGGQLFNYIQAVQGYLGTPIGALFVLAVLWRRMNERVSISHTTILRLSGAAMLFTLVLCTARLFFSLVLCTARLFFTLVLCTARLLV